MSPVSRAAVAVPRPPRVPSPAQGKKAVSQQADTFTTAPNDQAAKLKAGVDTFTIRLYADSLDRAPTADELQRTEALVDKLLADGKNIFEAGAVLVWLMKSGPEYQARHPFAPWVNQTFQDNLGREPSTDELKNTEKLIGTLLSQGKNIFEAGAVVNWLMKSGPEYQQKHPFAPWVNQTFQENLGRDPSADELKNTEKLIGDALAQGKNIFEAGALVNFLMKLGPEYQAKNPRAKILDVAQGEVGTVEATNNNDGDVAKYPGYFGRGPESYCANFVSYVLSNAGVPTDYFNTETMKNAFIEQGKWKGTSDPQPGDVVWFDWEGDGVTDHVGIVKSVNPDGSIHTIEGNTGNGQGQEGVWECDRPMSLINGFANPY